MEFLFQPYVLDNFCPAITVSEYIAQRADCASTYSLEVWLLPSDTREWMFYNQAMNPTFEKRINFQQWEGRNICKNCF